MPDLRVSLAGVELKNPIVVASAMNTANFMICPSWAPSASKD